MTLYFPVSLLTSPTLRSAKVCVKRSCHPDLVFTSFHYWLCYSLCLFKAPISFKHQEFEAFHPRLAFLLQIIVGSISETERELSKQKDCQTVGQAENMPTCHKPQTSAMCQEPEKLQEPPTQREQEETSLERV